MRDCSIETVDNPGEGLLGAWRDVVQDRKLLSITTCEFDLAEEVIGFMKFENQFEVGIGEPLRPYSLIYMGQDEQAAEDRFWQIVTQHVRNM